MKITKPSENTAWAVVFIDDGYQVAGVVGGEDEGTVYAIYPLLFKKHAEQYADSLGKSLKARCKVVRVKVDYCD